MIACDLPEPIYFLLPCTQITWYRKLKSKNNEHFYIIGNKSQECKIQNWVVQSEDEDENVKQKKINTIQEVPSFPIKTRSLPHPVLWAHLNPVPDQAADLALLPNIYTDRLKWTNPVIMFSRLLR